MIAVLQSAGYGALLWLLPFGGNTVCRLVLKLAATKTPPETGENLSLRAGRAIGVLERLLVFLSLAVGRWGGFTGALPQ